MALCAAFLAGYALECAAQRPLLKIDVEQGDEIGGPVKGGYNISITNTADVAATAYDIEIRCHQSDGSAGSSGEWIDGIPGNWSIAAGATLVKHYGGTPETLAPNIDPQKVVAYFATIDSVTNVAVLYADGSSAGDPDAVNLFVLEREADLSNIGKALTLLAANRSTGAPTLAEISDQLQQLAQAKEAQLKAADPKNMRGWIPDPVCRGAARALERATTPSRVASVIAKLQEQQAQLQASRPSLQ